MNINHDSVQVFREVAQSFKEQMQQGKMHGHIYLTIDPHTKVIRSSHYKKDAASFREITHLVDQSLKSKRISVLDKQTILESYQIITKNFKNKQLNLPSIKKFFAKLFKSFQVSQAKKVIRARIHLLNAQFTQLKQAREKFIYRLTESQTLKQTDLIDLYLQGTLSTSEPSNLNFQDCYKIKSHLLKRLKSNQKGDNLQKGKGIAKDADHEDLVARLNRLVSRLNQGIKDYIKSDWKSFKEEVQKITGYEDISSEFLRELDEIYK